MNLDDKTIAIIGLGYVGLPLAVEFGKQRPVVGFDINPARIAALQSGHDHTQEVSREGLAQARHLAFTCHPADIAHCQVYIVTVPTTVDKANRPDLAPLIQASETVGQLLKPGDLVVYESTVYPGATEEVCVPVLEKDSGLVFNQGFYCGYSPERTNPGDKVNTLTTIRKVTSGSTPEAAEAVDQLYRQIITAGTHKASSIQVAEAAKVIENTQRDVNIALMNELSLIFQRLGIDTLEVLQASGSQWNALPFRPGLVGGHSVGAAPYYLAHKAQQMGYHPEVILAGRRINDRMASHVARETIRHMLGKGLPVAGARVLVLGLTYKENCPDLRNTKVVDIVHSLQSYGACVDVYDPWIDPAEAMTEYGLPCLPVLPQTGPYSAVVLAVAHQQFVAMGTESLRALGHPGAVLFDVKSVLALDEADARL